MTPPLVIQAPRRVPMGRRRSTMGDFCRNGYKRVLRGGPKSPDFPTLPPRPPRICRRLPPAPYREQDQESAASGPEIAQHLSQLSSSLHTFESSAALKEHCVVCQLELSWLTMLYVRIDAPDKNTAKMMLNNFLVGSGSLPKTTKVQNPQLVPQKCRALHTLQALKKTPAKVSMRSLTLFSVGSKPCPTPFTVRTKGHTCAHSHSLQWAPSGTPLPSQSSPQGSLACSPVCCY
eukprot:1162014-Pelagomonas_calceolata.AAC.18